MLRPVTEYVKIVLPPLAVGVPVDTVAPLQFVVFTAKPPFTEVTFIASLNVTLTDGVKLIPVALFVGVVLLTVGGVTSGAAEVVQVAEYAEARAFAAASVAAVVTQVAYTVEVANPVTA